jgi:hypothetical protein
VKLQLSLTINRDQILQISAFHDLSYLIPLLCDG